MRPMQEVREGLGSCERKKWKGTYLITYSGPTV